MLFPYSFHASISAIGRQDLPYPDVFNRLFIVESGQPAHVGLPHSFVICNHTGIHALVGLLVIVVRNHKGT